MKTLSFLIAIFILTTGCETTKYLSVLNGSKSDGTLVMAYEYGGFQKPIVQWNDANARADQYCKSWGYKGHQWFDPQYICIWKDAYGNCTTYRVIYRCQCTQ